MAPKQILNSARNFLLWYFYINCTFFEFQPTVVYGACRKCSLSTLIVLRGHTGHRVRLKSQLYHWSAIHNSACFNFALT